MDKSFLAYNEEYVLDICSQASQNFVSKRYLLPAGSFGDIKSSRIHYFVLNSIKLILENRSKQSEFLVHYYYDNTILVMELNNKMREVMILFPYEMYDRYLTVIKQVNDLVSASGTVIVFANNNPYSLEAGVFISTAENYDKIIEIARINHMAIDSSRGLKEIVLGMGEKQGNTVVLVPNKDLDQIEKLCEPVFLWPPKKDLEKQGYSFSNYSKKKLFVSYCHKDKKVVRQTIDALRSYGLDFWIDEEQIDIGDRIMERIDRGMRESDIPIIFMSKHTKESMFAKHELQTFFSKIIYEQSDYKSWFLVKLDEVDLNEIVLGLSNFKYFDMVQDSVEDLGKKLQSKLKK